MRKYAILAITLILGFAGFILRRAELRTVFEETTGFAARNSPVSTALIALSVAVVVLSAIFAYVFQRETKKTESAIVPSRCAISTIVTASLGVLWLAASVVYFLNIRSAGALPIVQLYFSLINMLSAVSIILLAVLKTRSTVKLPLSVIPAIFMCFWLILVYKQNAANPVLLSFCYFCLAIICGTMSFYFTAGFAFEKPSPGKTVFSCIVTVFFCLTALADNNPLEVRGILAIIAALRLEFAFSLLKTADDLSEKTQSSQN